MSTAELELLDAATAAWGAFVRALRATSLYDPDHPQVRPFVEAFASSIRLCCTWSDPLVFTVTDRSLELGTANLATTTQFPPHLLARMHQDGVRQLHFRSSFVAQSAASLAGALSPYTSVGSAPMEPLSDVLRWTALSGLTFVIHGKTSFVADRTTRATTAWRARVLAPRPLPDPEHMPPGTVLAPVWDGKRGRIPWPLPVDENAIEEMKEQLSRANHAGVPMLRIGLVLADIAETWPRDERLREMLDVVAALVDGLLRDGLPDEASRLLQPLARWAERPATDPAQAALKRHIASFLTLLAHDSRLAILLDGLQRGQYAPDQVAAWFAALPAAELRHIVRFATTVPQGPFRDRLLDVAAEFATRYPYGLESVISTGTPAAALLALDALELLEDIHHHISMGCRAMERSEVALVGRGARLVSSIDDHAVSERMIGLLGSSHGDLRVLALRYVQRFRVVTAARSIEESITSAHFAQRPRPERILVGLAYGATGGSRAAEVAARQLGDDWRYMDVERVTPWILCLACSGDPRGSDPLDWLESQRLPGLSAALTDARNALVFSAPGRGLR